MNDPAAISIRAVQPSDLDALFRFQLDPEANRLAAFIARDPTDRAAFDVHWAKILTDPRNTNRTIVAGGVVVGSIACFPQDGALEVTYWVGRDYWGRGLATAGLRLLLGLITTRPIVARTATDNHGSLRVLQKCGFKITGKDRGFALGRGTETEEYLLRLDQTPEPVRATHD